MNILQKNMKSLLNSPPHHDVHGKFLHFYLLQVDVLEATLKKLFLSQIKEYDTGHLTQNVNNLDDYNTMFLKNLVEDMWVRKMSIP